jgi:hypothetical protein
MELVIYPRETQKAFVERTLRDHGRIDTLDVLYHLNEPDGQSRGITRLGAIIWRLRQEGWDIATDDPTGRVAVYTLISEPNATRSNPPTMAWRCTSCDTVTQGIPEPLLGGLGRGYCVTCRMKVAMRLVAA